MKWHLVSAKMFLAISVCWMVVHVVADEVVADPSPRFEAVDRLLVDHVERQQIAGAVALVLHEGRVVFSTAVGMRDREGKAEMTQDTIFRIASMTKPITSVAAMMLVEEGRLRLDDPLSQHLPEFARMKVVEMQANGQHRSVAARREITIHDLLTHQSGITYGFLAPEPIGKRYRDLGVSDGLVETRGTMEENIQRLAKAPLVNHPGEAWQYGLSTDVLGRVVEVTSGDTLDEFFQKRIFRPLGMHDSHFVLPKEKWPRLSALYHPAEDGTIEPVGKEAQREGHLTYSATYPYGGGGNYFSGGAGLNSNAGDYAKFLQMLLNYGELDGVRMLKAETVAEMTRNQIGELSLPFAIHGDKFGFGWAIHTENSPERNGASPGTYSWGGIFHTYFWVDPEQKVIGILMTQVYPYEHLSLRAEFQRSVYDALRHPSDTRRGLDAQPGGNLPRLGGS